MVIVNFEHHNNLYTVAASSWGVRRLCRTVKGFQKGSNELKLVKKKNTNKKLLTGKNKAMCGFRPPVTIKNFQKSYFFS